MYPLVQRELDKLILYESPFRNFLLLSFLFNPLPYSQSVLKRPIKLFGRKFPNHV